jgi:hypothetical protein
MSLLGPKRTWRQTRVMSALPTLGRREVSITNGGLKNGYISLSAMRDFFPREAIGGSKYASAAPKLFLQ